MSHSSFLRMKVSVFRCVCNAQLDVSSFSWHEIIRLRVSTQLGSSCSSWNVLLESPDLFEAGSSIMTTTKVPVGLDFSGRNQLSYGP